MDTTLPIDETTGRPVYKGLPVPYIAKWEGEIVLTRDTPRLLRMGEWMVVAYGHPEDRASSLAELKTLVARQRDRRGILWWRDTEGYGEDAPLFGQVHTKRQRQCMLERRCQVCARKVKPPFLFFGDTCDLIPPMGFGEFVIQNAPPVCPTCVPVALRLCPHWTPAHSPVFVEARKYSPDSTLSDVFNPATGMSANKVPLDFRSPHHRVAIAKQLVVKLSGVTFRKEQP